MIRRAPQSSAYFTVFFLTRFVLYYSPSVTNAPGDAVGVGLDIFLRDFASPRK
jgi:hypothetical protein